MSRRRVTAHTLKRRLMRKLDACSSFEAERVLLQLREYVIARRFLNGASPAGLARTETLGNAEWTQVRIEEAIRNGVKRLGARA